MEVAGPCSAVRWRFDNLLWAAMAKRTNRKSDAEAWFDAVYVAGLPAVKKLIAAGSDIECRDRDGRTPLMNACFEGHAEIISLLLKNGADVNAADNAGWTALHACAQEGHVSIAKLLLKAGANVDALDENGNSPLSNAVFNCAGEAVAEGAMIRLLLSAGARKSLKNKHGVSPLDLAKDIANFDLVKHFRG